MANNSRGQNTRLPGAIDKFSVAPIVTDGVTMKEYESVPHLSEEPSSSSALSSHDQIKHDFSSKKPRTQFSPKQLLYLEEKFLKNNFPNSKERSVIAKKLDLTPQHVQVWFQNRRAKLKRKAKKHDKAAAESRALIDPQPPSFWPSNLPFDSNISKVVSTTSADSETTGTPLPSANVSSPISKDRHKNDANVSGSELMESPLSHTSTAITAQESASNLTCTKLTRELNLQLVPHEHQFTDSLSSPSIFAESPVPLYNILNELPDVFAGILEEPSSSSVITTQAPTSQRQHHHLSSYYNYADYVGYRNPLPNPAVSTPSPSLQSQTQATQSSLKSLLSTSLVPPMGISLPPYNNQITPTPSRYNIGHTPYHEQSPRPPHLSGSMNVHSHHSAMYPQMGLSSATTFPPSISILEELSVPPVTTQSCTQSSMP